MVTRAWIEVEWDGDPVAGRAYVEGALDGLAQLLADDAEVADPFVVVTFEVPEALVWDLAATRAVGSPPPSAPHPQGSGQADGGS